MTVMRPGVETPEWILRACADCGYRRPEMCADA